MLCVACIPGDKQDRPWTAVGCRERGVRLQEAECGRRSWKFSSTATVTAWAICGDFMDSVLIFFTLKIGLFDL